MKKAINTVWFESTRALGTRWFVLAVLGTIVFLWFGLEGDAWWLTHINDSAPNAAVFILKALVSDSAVFTLPALAALPAATSAFTEFSTGAARAATFRTGRAAYRAGKVCTCVVSACMSQLVGVAAFATLVSILAIIQGGTAPDATCIASFVGPVASRMLSGAAFASFGAMIALAAGSAASALAAPMAACFALKLVGSRFFIGVRYIDPTDWLAGDMVGLIVSFGVLIFTAAVLDIVLGMEMIRHA